MSKRHKIHICIAGNTASLLIVVVLVSVYAQDSPFWRVGPHDDLQVISTRIDSWSKYAAVVALITIVNVIRVLSEEIGIPILNFNVYNPDKKVIEDFGRFELNIYANLMYTTGSVRDVFSTVVAITQIDLALISVMVRELATVWAVYHLLSEKTFVDPTKGEKIHTSDEEDKQGTTLEIV